MPLAKACNLGGPLGPSPEAVGILLAMETVSGVQEGHLRGCLIPPGGGGNGSCGALGGYAVPVLG